MRATADNLRRLTSAIVKAGGSSVQEADLVAEHLVRANLMGHDSHGVGMIPTYIRHLKAGLVVPNTRAKLVKDDGAMLMFDGGRGTLRRSMPRFSSRSRSRRYRSPRPSAATWSTPRWRRISRWITTRRKWCPSVVFDGMNSPAS